MARVLDGLWPRTPGTAAVLVGHGSEHPGSMAYPALQGALDLMGRADLVVGTVEGWPDREAVLKRLEELRAERVLLLPLLLAAGVHAREDIAGPGPDSWNSALEAAGLQTQVLKTRPTASPTREPRYTTFSTLKTGNSSAT